MDNYYRLTEDALHALPNGRFVRFEVTKDFLGNRRKAVIWRFVDGTLTGIREAAFCIDTGDYLGEVV